MPFKLLRSPNSTIDQSKKSRLSFNLFYFATVDTQKDSGLKIEFMLDTGASSSIKNYRIVWKICQSLHPITVKRGTTQTRTYSGQVVPLIGFATLTFSYDPGGQIPFPLTVWITEMKTQNPLGMDFCQKQVSGIRFDLPGFALEEPPNTVCYANLHQNKSYPFISESRRVRTPYAMHIEAKSVRCWKYFPEDPHAYFPPGRNFHTNCNAVATGLSFGNVLCTQSESKLPIILEKNKNHQSTLPKGRIDFSSLDVSDKNEPKLQIRDPYELTNAIFSTNEQYNDCFLLHSTIPSQSQDEFLQIVYGNENSILKQPNSIGHCISADAQMSKGFAQFLSERIPRLRRTCRRANLLKDQVLPFWDSSSRRYYYNLVTNAKYSDKHDLQFLATTLQIMQAHATMHGISLIAIQKIRCGLDQMNWQDVVKLLRAIFAYSDIQTVVSLLDEHAIHALSAERNPEFYAEDEIDRYSEELHLNERELETEFTCDAKSCQLDCDEQFPILRPERAKRGPY